MVERTTVWRWRRDPAFQTELGRRREELWSDSVDRMSGLLGPALDVLADALDDGDRSIAMQFLRLLGVGDVALERVRRIEPGAVNGSGVPWSVAELDAQLEALSAEMDRRQCAAAEGVGAYRVAPERSGHSPRQLEQRAHRTFSGTLD